MHRRVGPVRDDAQDIREAHRRTPARAGADRRHGRRDRGRAAPGVARGRPQRQRPAEHARDEYREALRIRGRAARRRQCHSDSRRLRLLRRVPGRTVLARRARESPLRGDDPDPEAHHRPLRDRHRRDRLMEWDEPAEGVLVTLCRMVPDTIRELARAAARDEAESVAGQRAAANVSVDDVIRGWIRTTPPEQRNGLVAVIEQLGLEPEIYETELQSDEGWEEEPEDSGM